MEARYSIRQNITLRKGLKERKPLSSVLVTQVNIRARPSTKCINVRLAHDVAQDFYNVGSDVTMSVFRLIS